MPELVEQMYCAQQIVIPPKFPYVLKRYCKAAIKTQPYDLLRWSYEYFKALAENRPPPVKLRLEYPVYGTEGGLTRGCLKVLANQLAAMKEVPLTIVKRVWQGFCLDPHELVRILCYCEVYLRAENVPFLHFVAVAGGMLTKCLTHTMILLCETLTEDPDGGAASIPVEDFLTMYQLLARMDASRDCQYIRGFRDGLQSYVEEVEELGEEEGTAITDEKILQEISAQKMASAPKVEGDEWPKEEEEEAVTETELESVQQSTKPEETKTLQAKTVTTTEEARTEQMGESMSEGEEEMAEPVLVASVIDDVINTRGNRIEFLLRTFGEIKEIVDKFKSANYDLGMVAGRQMSTTSGEFIVQHIEKEILEYIDEQIGVLPDPDLKRKKAKPEEVAMIKDILKTFLDENIDVICPEVEEVEEEEEPIPDIVTVYAIPGIGPPVEEDIIKTFREFTLDVSKSQADMFMPRNIRHFLCPPLEKYEETKYADMKATIEIQTK